MLSAEELLAGGALVYDIEIPRDVLLVNGKQPGGKVKLRPLTVRDLQLITNAAKQNDALSSALMVQTSLIEPKLTLAQINTLHVGLLQYLLGEVNRISGISSAPEELKRATEEPLIRAAFLLTREFGWTPEEVGHLTLGQILLHLQMLKEQQTVDG